MGKLIKAQIRELFQSRIKFILLIFGILFGILSSVTTGADDLSASSFIVNAMSVQLITLMFFVAASVGEICAGDFTDKTLYNELMHGTRREHTYAARALVSIVFTLIGSSVILIVPVIFSTIVWGWGTCITVGDFLTRLLIVLLPLLRLACFYICFSFIVRNKYVVIITGFVILEAYGLLGQALADAPYQLLSITSFTYAATVDSWAAFGLEGNENYIYLGSLPTENVISIAICSIAAAAIYYIIGRSFFKHDDLN